MVDVRDLMRLDGRVAIVTGGARGIGRETAETLALAGSRVVLADLDKSTTESAAGEMRAMGLHASAIVVDVADEASVEFDGAGDARARGQARHSRQQRRHCNPARSRRSCARRLGQSPVGQHDGVFLVRSRRRAAHDGGRRWRRNRERGLDHGPVRWRPLSQRVLSGDQGRDRQYDPRARGRMGAARHSKSTRSPQHTCARS